MNSNVAYRSSGTLVEANATTVAPTYTATAGDLLVAVIGHLQGAAPTGVSSNVDGAFTQIETELGGGLRHCSVWVKANVTGGAHTVTATFAASDACAGVVHGYSGVRNADPFSGAVKANAANALPTISVTSPDGGKAVVGIVHSTAGTGYTATNGTNRNYQETANFGAILTDRDGVGSTTVDGTITGAPTETAWTAVGCNLNAAIRAAVLSAISGDA